MKISIRKGLFETNSSSVHSLTMCTQSDYDRWKRGELVYSDYHQDLIPASEAGDDCYSFDEFWSDKESYYNTFEESCNGVVAFGYYGYD